MTISNLVLTRGYVATPTPLTAVAQTLQIDCNPNGSAFVQVLTAAALAGFTMVFEGRVSEAAPWATLAANASNGTNRATCIAATPVLTAVPANGWVVGLNGCVQFRVRVTAITGGNCTVGIRLSDTSYG